MYCRNCSHESVGNVWTCPDCHVRIEGGVVFVTGITGSLTDKILEGVERLAVDHHHPVCVHDVGALMRAHAERTQTIEMSCWERILDSSPRVLRLLRALAFSDIERKLEEYPSSLHIVDLHLSFRWSTNLTPGFEPYMIRGFLPHVRLLLNVVPDLDNVQRQLESTAWGRREILELLVWRDEELLLTDVYAGICGGVRSYAVAAAEPPETIESLIWHPDRRKVYLSFPITAIQRDEDAKKEIEAFRDALRDFVVVFNPAACRDYEKTYERPEMKALRSQVGNTTIARDFRFIDQADAVVVYYPKKVTSKGVDAEMRYAFETGKKTYLYCPYVLEYGPFQPPAAHVRRDRREFEELLREELSPTKEEEQDA